MVRITPRATHVVPRTILQGNEVPWPRQHHFNPDAGLAYEFFNGLGRAVTVSLRTGVRYVIPSIPGTPFRGFLVRTRYEARGFEVKVDAGDLSNDLGRKSSVEAELLVKSRLFNAPSQQQQVASLDYVISPEEFDLNGGSIYLSNVDLCLSSLNPAYASPHPYSLVGGRNETLLQEMESMPHGLLYRIRIIDQHGRYGDRYINLNGEVFQIRHERDTDLRDGVYALGHNPATGEFEMCGPRTLFFEFETADKELRLYRSHLEARTLGDPDSSYKRELDRVKHDNAVREQELKAERLQQEFDHAQRVRELEREREEAKARFQQKEDQLKEREFILSNMEHLHRIREQELKKENMVIKDIFDHNATRRKETIEILKYAPALITGLGALYTVYKKVTS